MSSQYPIPANPKQTPAYCPKEAAQALGRDLALFLFPLLVHLDQLLEKRKTVFIRSGAEASPRFRSLEPGA